MARNPSEAAVPSVNSHVAVLSENAAGAGSMLAAALRKAGYQASLVEASPEIAASLTQLGPDRVFNALTGALGRGMVQGLVFEEPELAGKVCALAYEDRLLAETSGPSDEVVKLLPPLTIDEDDLKRGLDILSKAVATVATERTAEVAE